MGKTHIVSPSELSTFQQCPHKHDLSYKQRWVTETTAPALTRGTAWHAMLEAHYLTIQAHQRKDGTYDLGEAELLVECARAAMQALADTEIDETEADLLRWMYTGHVEQWDLDRQWRIVAVESRGEFWLPTDRGGRSNFKLKMKLDLVVRDLVTGGLWIVDHKSGKDLPRDKELDLDDQFGLYEWGLRQSGRKIVGTVYNSARTQRNKTKPQELDDRFRRYRMSRTDIELDTIAVEAYRTFRTAYSYRENEAPRATNSDTCRWKCSFTDACLLARKGVNQQETLVDFGFRQDFTRH